MYRLRLTVGFECARFMCAFAHIAQICVCHVALYECILIDLLIEIFLLNISVAYIIVCRAVLT